MLNCLVKDAFFCHKMKFHEKNPSFFSWLRVILFSKGLFSIALHRLIQSERVSRATGLMGCVVKIVLSICLYFQQILTKIYIRSETIIDCGVYLSGRGHIILGAKSVGSGTVIHDRVTVGMNILHRGIPEIGRDVWIGPNSIIYGNIHVGEGSTIMPRTVLTKSIPARVVVRGNPARIVMQNFDNYTLRSNLNTDIDLMNFKL